VIGPDDPSACTRLGEEALRLSAEQPEVGERLVSFNGLIGVDEDEYARQAAAGQACRSSASTLEALNQCPDPDAHVRVFAFDRGQINLSKPMLVLSVPAIDGGTTDNRLICDITFVTDRTGNSLQFLGGAVREKVILNRSTKIVTVVPR